jgi:uncharacterized protein
MIDPGLLKILVCPACKGKLQHVDYRVRDYSGEGLHCQSCNRLYPMRDGLPVLLVADAVEPPGAAFCGESTAMSALGDIYRTAFQLENKVRRLRKENGELRDRLRQAEETAIRAGWDNDTLRADLFKPVSAHDPKPTDQQR